MKTSTNVVLQVVLGIVATGLITAIANGDVEVPAQYRWVLTLIVTPVAMYFVSILPKPGTEDLLDLADKIGLEEAKLALRSYLYKTTEYKEKQAIRRKTDRGSDISPRSGDTQG